MDDVTLLLTPQALADAGEAAFDTRLVPADDPVLEREMRHAVRHAQEAVRGVLGFHPLVHVRATYARGYVYPDALTGRRALYPTGPVAEVFTPEVTAADDGVLVLGDDHAPEAYPFAVTYAAGWRGEHHTLTPGETDDEGRPKAPLTDLPGLSALTALPALVPGDVRSVIVEVALIELDRRRHDLLGGRAKIVNIGEGQYQSDAYRPDAEALALSRLSSVHRHVHV